MGRKFSIQFTLILFMSAVLGTLSFSPSAIAQPKEPEVYFYPAQGWSIEKEDTSCSIISKFNNGFIMRFHGTDKWVQGMSIDFRQDVFEAGKKYDVALSVPGIQNETFKGMGDSSQALSINLRKQKDFYQSLRKAAVLDLTLEGNNFRFYLTGFSKSAGEFERCMAGAVIAKTGEAAGDDKNFLVNESIAMEEKIKSGESVLVEILPEDPKPVAKIIPVKETRKVGNIVLESATAEIVTSADELLKTQEKSIMPVKHKRLSEQLAEQIENNPSLIEIDDTTPIKARKPLKMPPNMEELPLVPAPAPVAQKVETKDEPKPEAAPKAAPPPKEELATPLPVPPVEEEKKEEITPAPEKIEMAVAPEKIEEPIEDVKEVAPPPAIPAPKRIQKSSPPMKVNKERIKAKADFSDLRPSGASNAEIVDLRDQLKTLNSMVSDLKSENKALNGELKSSLRESEEERLSISSENWNLERATMKFNEAERQIKKLGGQLQRERAKCNGEKRDLEALLFDPQVTDQAQLARLAELEEQLMKAQQELEDQRMRYEEQIRQRWEAGDKAP